MMTTIKKITLTLGIALSLAIGTAAIPAQAETFNSVMSGLQNASPDVEYKFDDTRLTSNELMTDIAGYYRNNDPLVFYSLRWRDGNIRYFSATSTGRYVGVSASSKFISSLNDQDDFASWFISYVNSVIASAGISDNDTDSEKVTKLVNYIADHYIYDNAGANVNYYNSSTGLMEQMYTSGKTFCTTDAMMMVACCDRLSIPCRYIEGSSNGSDMHAWNEVCIDGIWSEVDVSFARKAADKSSYIFFHSGRRIDFKV